MKLLYLELSDNIKELILNGTYKTGDKLPGVRSLAHSRQVSISTVLSAYQKLENEELIESKSRSGFFVRSLKPINPIRTNIDSQSAPVLVSKQEFILSMMASLSNQNIINLGAVSPSFNLTVSRHFDKSLRKILTNKRLISHGYAHTSGVPELRRQLAKLMSYHGALVEHDQIVVTSGCQEGLTLALRVLTKPGDIVAVESPTYYGLLQIMEGLGLKVLEVSCDPNDGISLNLLRNALERYPIKACVLIPTFNNPLGYCMSDDRKVDLIRLLEVHSVTLVEDDIYGDLSFEQVRPKSCKSLAPNADIIYCSSFSKSLEPGIRVGWIASDRYYEKIKYQKLLLNIASPSLQQLALTDFLEAGHYENHLRKIRSIYAAHIYSMSNSIMEWFPDGTCISEPKGGFVLWVELDKKIDTFQLGESALRHGISIAPGKLFSTTAKYDNYIRLTSSNWEDHRVKKSLKKLAGLIKDYNQ